MSPHLDNCSFYCLRRLSYKKDRVYFSREESYYNEFLISKKINNMINLNGKKNDDTIQKSRKKHIHLDQCSIFKMCYR